MGRRLLSDRFPGWLYEKGSSARTETAIEVDDAGGVYLNGDFAGDWASLQVSDRLGDIPRRLAFQDGRSCETPANECVDRLERRFRRAKTGLFLHLLESRWKWAGAALACALVAGWLGVQYGVPALSRQIAFLLPHNIMAATAQQTLGMMDRVAFAPSKLDENRRREIERLLQRAATATGGPFSYDLALRDGGGFGANAFALPNGAIVVTDQLANLAADDDQLLGVLAHEIGHVQNRHGMQRVIQASLAAGIALIVLGDVSQTVSALPTLLLENAYSREAEREADLFAANLMDKMGAPPAALAAMLERLRQKELEDHVPGWISTHPPTEERVELIKKALPLSGKR